MTMTMSVRSLAIERRREMFLLESKRYVVLSSRMLCALESAQMPGEINTNRDFPRGSSILSRASCHFVISSFLPSSLRRSRGVASISLCCRMKIQLFGSGCEQFRRHYRCRHLLCCCRLSSFDDFFSVIWGTGQCCLPADQRPHPPSSSSRLSSPIECCHP